MTTRQGKRIADVAKTYDHAKKYHFSEAFDLMQKAASKKFDETVDLAINLGIDPKKSDQMVRGSCVYPHGLGKKVVVLAIVPPDKVEEATKAGADFVGGDDMIEKIQSESWVDYDKLLTTPAMMGKVGKLGKVLGRRGLMPNPKVGTVTNDIAEAIKMAKAGKVEFKVNKAGVLCVPIGKVSFGSQKLQENAEELFRSLVKLKPSTAKGAFIKKISLSSTMGPGVKIDENDLLEKV
ncbi:MAG TPA: 50S ribosomal protein L1 [bacterium]|nr:50S ribosomal protein L1 [bacterium]